MLENIFTYLVLGMISFFPIVIWAYIFSYIDNNPLNKKRFFVGVFGGALSVIPILYIDKIISLIDFKYLNIFLYASEIKGLFSSIEFGISLALFLFIVVFLSFIGGGIFFKFKKILSVYLKNLLVFLFFVLVLTFGIFGLNFILDFVNFEINNSVAFGEIVFNSLKLIIFYYLIVAFIEESAKHFNFLQSSILHIDSIKTGVLYAIFVALGFALIENMLYLYNMYLVNGFGSELIRLYFFRSAFSIVVHILSSSIIAYYFTKALLLYREKELSFPYLKIFSVGIFISILLHLIFDVALTLGFTFVIFLYFIFGYLYVSSLFYRE